MNADPWNQGDEYERFMGRWSRPLADVLVPALALPPGLRWLDVGCGTGALAAAILELAEPASVVGVEPSAGFRDTATRRLGGRAAVLDGDAASIPLVEASADVTVSALVLNFVPDPTAALAEMKRVTQEKGTIAACVWDYAGGMRYLRAFWDAAAALDPAAKKLDEGARFPLCDPEALRALFASAGLADVRVEPVTIEMRFADFGDLWTPFLGGQGPAPGYAASLDETKRARLREAMRAQLSPGPDGSIVLPARAWLVRGVTTG